MILWCAVRNIQFKSLKLDQTSSPFNDDITDVGLYLLSKQCTNMKRLHLHGLHTVTGEGLAYLAASCPHLQVLRADESFCNDSLESFGRSCKALTDISIINDRVAFIAMDSNYSMHTLLKDCTRLKHFQFIVKFSRAYLDFMYTALNVDAFTSLSAKSHLETIVIHDIEIDSPFIQSLTRGCKLLKTIYFNTSDITDSILRAIGRNCPLLESLVLKSCYGLVGYTMDISTNEKVVTNDSIHAFTVGCPLLKYLEIEGYTEANNESIIDIAKNCPLLEGLHFQNIEFSPTGFTELGKLQHLSKLYFNDSVPMFNAFMSNFFIHHNGSLKEILIPSKAHATSEILNMQAKHCPHLEKFSYYGYTCFDETAMLNLVYACTQLKEIQLNVALSGTVWNELNRRVHRRN